MSPSSVALGRQLLEFRSCTESRKVPRRRSSRGPPPPLSWRSERPRADRRAPARPLRARHPMLPPDSAPSHSSPVASPSPEQPLPSLWAVTWPLFLSLGLSLSLHFTDAFFLSRISDSAAAA